MKYRLNVKVNKRMWKLGIVVYNTILEAQIRQEELRLVGITSKVVDEFGGKLTNTTVKENRMKTIARVGYYNGNRVIKGLHAKSWDEWYILNGSRITGIAGEYCEDELIPASDSEVSQIHTSEVELTIQAQ